MQERTAEIWAEQDRHGGDRLRLFSALQQVFAVERALYPGSWADIAPSFVIDDVTYVDADRRAKQFFEDAEGVDELIARHRTSATPATWRFVAGDYREALPVAEASVDLLVSMYAGFVTDACTRYLRSGGLLVVNPSHGDAGLAALDPGYELVGAVQSRDGDYRVVTDRLERFLRPKKPEEADAEVLRERGRGIAYTTTAFAYVFRWTHPSDAGFG